jgi:hypothetical protein
MKANRKVFALIFFFSHNNTHTGKSKYRQCSKYLSDDAKTAFQRWFRAQPAEFYNSGISQLVVRWDKCLNWGGDYVEK